MTMLYNTIIQSKFRIILFHEGMHIYHYNGNRYVHISLLHVQKDSGWLYKIFLEAS
jgi:hypothetical protein